MAYHILRHWQYSTDGTLICVEVWGDIKNGTQEKNYNNK